MILYAALPLLITIIILKVKKIQTKDIINSIFWGIVSVILVTIISSIIFSTPNVGLLLSGGDVSFAYFILILLKTALPEELSKFLCIKHIAKKEKNSIFINSILIGLTFACVENFIYISSFGVRVGLTRMLHPGHLLFQILMSIILIKSLNKSKNTKILFNIFAIIIPAVCHSIFNTFNEINIMSYIFYAIGIITYIFTFICLIKLTNDSKEENKIKFVVPKIIVIIFTLISLLVLISPKSNINLNEVQIIDEDKIEMKVISSEKTEITDDIDIINGKYIKVKIEIKNNSNIVYELDEMDFKITDELDKNNSNASYFIDDEQLNQIMPGETKVGYIHFKDEGYKYAYLIYVTGEIGNTVTYDFKIK